MLSEANEKHAVARSQGSKAATRPRRTEFVTDSRVYVIFAKEQIIKEEYNKITPNKVRKKILEMPRMIEKSI